MPGRDPIVESGLRLLDVASVVFPEHRLMKQLRKEFREEREELRAQMMGRFWRDNGPWALLRAMKLCNASCFSCDCPNCQVNKKSVQISCRLWDRFTWFMSNCGISYCVISVSVQDVWQVGAESRTFITSVPNHSADAFPARPEGFNPLTACKHLAPVSHIDTHIVFQRVGSNLGITYGRKLWEADSISSPEIRKLDLLFARLNN